MLTEKELNSLFKVSNWREYQDYLLFYTIACCGLRLGEARALRGNQIYTNKQILIVNGFCKNNGVRTIYNKKGSADDPRLRVVPIPDSCFIKLMQYINNNKLKNDDFIFLRNNKPVRQEYLEKAF